MILIIDTADAKKVFIALARENKIISQKKFNAQYQQTEKLLPAIDKLLKTKNYKLKTIQGIIVVLGPGPFTALRVGITTANTLAYALKIPAVGFKVADFKNYRDLLKKGIKVIKSKKENKILEPFYGQGLSITKK